jgi:hypothetical protein
MKDNLQFRVSAELKNILGRDLITSPDIAILELVKNSYDAHASKVEITFDDDYLSIADNGKGMSKDDLINKWLFVAYSAKSDGTEDKSYRSKFKRHYAGAKGIGRMSCDRLAKKLVLTTRSAEENKTEVLHVDWSTFELSKQTEFDTIDIPHETLDTIPAFPLSSPTGTLLEFTGLHLSWTRDNIIRLKKSLEKMINPFSGTDDDFQIEIIAPQMREDDIKAESQHEVVNGVIENSIADVLKLKTTEIASYISNGIIHTTLTDRGIIMYEIEEPNRDYSLLDKASVSIFYLNRSAKYNFTAQMGIEPVKYGNVFLFRNGFRILPFGDFNDDSWELNRRVQQGYNRFLGTRELFGRVDIETDNPDLIKEVSSRDGGLIKTDASQQLMDYFTLIHRRLERYVVGVLWGEGFLRKEYFINQASALNARKQLEGDKDSDTAKHLYSNIGSKVDFLQLIKSLVNDKSISVIQYNEDLANIVANPTDTEVIQAQMLDDVRKLAEKTNDSYLLDKLSEFERHLDDLRRKKVEAERKAEEERKAKEEAEHKYREEEKKREKAENELKQKTKQNLFLLSVGTLDTDRILKYHHDIRIHAATIHNTIGQILKKANRGQLTADDTTKLVERISRANDKITSIAQFATKANYSIDTDDIKADIVSYISEYINNVLPEFYGELALHCSTNSCSKTLKFAPIEASIFIDNLVSNTVKFNAKHFDVFFEKKEDAILMTISDDGDGLSSKVTNPDSIFEKGITTTNGSGLGLYNVASFVNNVLKGTITVDNSQDIKGFKLIIKF